MHDSAHLLFPLLSSILFVIAATFAKQATVRSQPLYGHGSIQLSIGPMLVCLRLRSRRVAADERLVECTVDRSRIVGGQLSTYLAFRLGDVSLATPVFGVKIIIVAFISSVVHQSGIELRTWIAAGLATVGVIVMQLGGTGAQAPKLTTRRAAMAIGFALLAATSLSIFDVGVQIAGKRYGATTFLTTMFSCVGLLSLGLFPWTDRVDALKKNEALKPLVLAAVLMAAQAISITFSLAQFGDATRINIVYSLRGLWSVLAWQLSRWSASPEGHPSKRTLAVRLIGTTLLTAAVLVALNA